jgi:hypothetical protein
MSDSEVGSILAAAVATVTSAVPELQGYDRVVPTIQVPAVMAFPPDRVSYGETFDGDGTMLFVLRLFVQRAQDGSDQQKLNGYISRDGPSSVVAAIRDNPRLGGVVADVHVVEAANYGNWPVGQLTYLGVELRVQAMLG